MTKMWHLYNRYIYNFENVDTEGLLLLVLSIPLTKGYKIHVFLNKVDDIIIFLITFIYMVQSSSSLDIFVYIKVSTDMSM